MRVYRNIRQFNRNSAVRRKGVVELLIYVRESLNSIRDRNAWLASVNDNVGTLKGTLLL